MRHTLALVAAAVAISSAALDRATAQSLAPPDTSVRALEPPVDVRRRQLEHQTPPAATAGTTTRTPGAMAPVVGTSPRQ